jgi:hypothetical protein
MIIRLFSASALSPIIFFAILFFDNATFKREWWRYLASGGGKPRAETIEVTYDLPHGLGHGIDDDFFCHIQRHGSLSLLLYIAKNNQIVWRLIVERLDCYYWSE